MNLDPILAAAAICVLGVLALVWIDQGDRRIAREEQANEQPPKPSQPPLRFEFTIPLDPATLPNAEQLELSQDERDTEIEALYELLPDLDVRTDLRADQSTEERP
ncbi:hypothetical protein [Streptacidiphilus sp. MAP5-3]|uniref:hypothetical protein n=1 Tax=unclassified Streptacidiphilus TaxID=2643834 RepID=UPI003516280E